MNVKYMYSFLAVLVLFLLAYVGVEGLGLEMVFGIFIPYLAVLAFIVGFVRRVLGWGKSAVPFAIPTTAGQQKSLPWIESSPIDNPTTKLGVWIRMALEVLTFRSLFRNTRMKLGAGPKISYHMEIFLWVGALAFHYAFFTTLVPELGLMG